MQATDLDLDSSELRSLVVLAEQRHFGRAAEILCVSQPALTKRLQRLEQKVGGPLLLRGYRDLRLTEPGRVLLERAKVLLRETALAIEVSRRAVAGEAGLLRIGFGAASVARLLPEILLRFRRAQPRVQIVMRDMASPAQVQALQREEIDLGFVRMPVTDPELEAVPILHERLVAAIGARSPWRDRAGLRSLAGEPFVVCSRTVSTSYYDHVGALCRSAGFTPRIVTETNDVFSQLHLVRAGIGVALVPSAATSMRVPGVRIKTIRLREARWDIAMVWRKQREPAPLVEAFVRVARQVYAG
jgi:DNA-binding transcriptional LysR family regulator